MVTEKVIIAIQIFVLGGIAELPILNNNNYYLYVYSIKIIEVIIKLSILNNTMYNYILYKI